MIAEQVAIQLEQRLPQKQTQLDSAQSTVKASTPQQDNTQALHLQSINLLQEKFEQMQMNMTQQGKNNRKRGKNNKNNVQNQ